MSLRNIVAKGVKIASKVTDSLKETVLHQAWIGDDGKGGESFATAVPRRAIVDKTKRVRATGTGQLVMTFATLTFLDPIGDTTPTPGQVRENPIDPRDIITLADGGTAPIVQTGGPDDPSTGKPFLQETILGTVQRGQ